MKMYILDENGHVVFEAEERGLFRPDYFQFTVGSDDLQFRTLGLVKHVYKHLISHVIREEPTNRTFGV